MRHCLSHVTESDNVHHSSRKKRIWAVMHNPACRAKQRGQTRAPSVSQVCFGWVAERRPADRLGARSRTRPADLKSLWLSPLLLRLLMKMYIPSSQLHFQGPPSKCLSKMPQSPPQKMFRQTGAAGPLCGWVFGNCLDIVLGARYQYGSLVTLETLTCGCSWPDVQSHRCPLSPLSSQF